MKKASEIFDAEEYPSYYNYRPMLEEFGTILLQVDDANYSGDTRVLYRDGIRYGWLQFGWGSCSGCDALQGCRDIDEVQTLMDSLCQSIVWFDDRDVALKFFNEHDWEGDYSFDAEEQKEFIEKAKELLKG